MISVDIISVVKEADLYQSEWGDSTFMVFGHREQSPKRPGWKPSGGASGDVIMWHMSAE